MNTTLKIIILGILWSCIKC